MGVGAWQHTPSTRLSVIGMSETVARADGPGVPEFMTLNERGAAMGSSLSARSGRAPVFTGRGYCDRIYMCEMPGADREGQRGSVCLGAGEPRRRR